MEKFNLMIAQKRGMTAATNKLVSMLVAVLLVSALGASIFTYLGSGNNGLANTTYAPGVPTWLPTTLIVVVAVGILYLVIKAAGIGSNK